MNRWLPLLALLAACGGGDPGTHVMMGSRADDFFAAPFPSNDLLVDGHPDLSGFPNPGHAILVDQARTMAESYDGFATTGGVFFQISAPIDPAGLPDLAGSTAPSSSVFLFAVDTGERVPVDVTFQLDGGDYGGPNLLALVPVQGIPLRPGAVYAAVVTTAIVDEAGVPLAAARDLPAGVDWPSVADPATIAGATVFDTGDPGGELRDAVTTVQGPPLAITGLALTDTFTDFCVYQTTVSMRDYQDGTPPYSTEGGRLDLTAAHTEDATLVITLPITPPPLTGYPVVVFSRTGAGGDRPVVDRGQETTHGGPPIEPGEGPGRYFARAGFAAIEVDGPLGGARNPNGADEQFLTFNVNNLWAMRDNVRESALELAILEGSLADAGVPDCAGTSTVSFDTDHVALMGHSMGAWIAPLAAAFDPGFGALVLSGAGGSWIENVLYKKQPLAVLPFILVLVQEQSLRADDPVLTLAQWALEPADPQVYGAYVADRHILMEQGIVDNYILPRIANATSLAMGLDLAGDELDTLDDPRLAEQQALGPLLPMVGRGPVPLPATGNVVVQHAEDGLEDGHEVVFQTDGPKHQYQCFLASWLTGTPTVPVDDARDAPCP